MTDYNQPCSDTVDLNDTYGRTAVYTRLIEEGGLVPTLTLEPTLTLIPLTALTISDVHSNQPTKPLADGFMMASDVVGPFAIGKGGSESITIADGITRAFVKNLEEAGMVPALDLYPSTVLVPQGSFAIYDVVGRGFYTLLLDVLGIGDAITAIGIGRIFEESLDISDSTLKGVVKYISELGLQPSNTLYPSTTLYPYSGLKFNDIVGSGLGRELSEALGVTDSDANTIVKGLSDNIYVLDSILAGFRLYFSENFGILDAISKGEIIYPEESFNIVDGVVKNSVNVLSESMVVDDTMEKTLRTLVRASLRAIKNSTCTVSVM